VERSAIAGKAEEGGVQSRGEGGIELTYQRRTVDLRDGTEKRKRWFSAQGGGDEKKR